MEEYQLATLERDSSACHGIPRCVGSTVDISGEPLGSGFLLGIEALNVVGFAHEECFGIVDELDIDGIGSRCSVVGDGNSERLGEVSFGAACRIDGGILAALGIEGSISEVNALARHHADAYSLFLFVDSALHAFEEEELELGFVVAHSNAIVHHEVAVADTESLVGIKVDVVAHLDIGLRTRRNGECRYGHVRLLIEADRHFHLQQTVFDADGGLKLVVEHELLDQTFA